jgi:hypothetical protein
VVPGVTGACADGLAHNLLIVATLDDYVWAFDAGNNTCNTGNLAWSKSLIYDLGDCGGSWPSGLEGLKSQPGSSLPYAGIVSTPAIDQTNGIVYVVGACNDGTRDHYVLHALRLATGSDTGNKVDISKATGSNPVYVPSSAGTYGATLVGTNYVLELSPEFESQRAALTLHTNANGHAIYIGFAVTNKPETPPDVSAGVTNPYHGWLAGYALNSDGTIATTCTSPNCASFAFASTATLDTSSLTCTAPGSGNGTISGATMNQYPADGNDCGLGGGVWQSGRGAVIFHNPVSNHDNIAISTGNGGFQIDAGTTVNFGSSVVAFDVTTTCNTTSSTTAGCAPVDFFTPNCYGTSSTTSYAGCTPTNPQFFTMSLMDEDMGTTGLTLTDIPSPSGSPYTILSTFGKDGTGYALDTAELGKFSGSTSAGTPDQAVGEFFGTTTSHLCALGPTGCTPPSNNSYTSGGDTYNEPCDGSTAQEPNPPYVYGPCHMITSQVYWDAGGENYYLFVFPTNEDLAWCYWNSSISPHGNFVCTPYVPTDSSDGLAPSGHPGGSLVLTLNNTASTPINTAILWSLSFEKNSVNVAYVDPGSCVTYGCFQGHLRAYALGGYTATGTCTSGTPGTTPPPGPPPCGTYPNFSVYKLWDNTDYTSWQGSPISQITVINGRVYVPTFNSGIRVYDNWE